MVRDFKNDDEYIAQVRPQCYDYRLIPSDAPQPIIYTHGAVVSHFMNSSFITTVFEAAFC